VRHGSGAGPSACLRVWSSAQIATELTWRQVGITSPVAVHVAAGPAAVVVAPPRQALEDIVLEALERHLLAPEYVQEFTIAFHTELNRRQHDAEILAGLKRKELEEIQPRMDGLIDAIADALRALGLQARLDQLENRKTELERDLAAILPTPPRFFQAC
jgi:hypothetical protein